MYWGWIIKYIRNVAITEDIPLHLNEIIDNFIVGGDGDIARAGLMPILKDENLVRICFKELRF